MYKTRDEFVNPAVYVRFTVFGAKTDVDTGGSLSSENDVWKSRSNKSHGYRITREIWRCTVCDVLGGKRATLYSAGQATKNEWYFSRRSRNVRECQQKKRKRKKSVSLWLCYVPRTCNVTGVRLMHDTRDFFFSPSTIFIFKHNDPTDKNKYMV